MSIKLDAINAMLIATDEAPVSSDESMHPSAIQASTWFDINNIKFQQRGWWFNTEYKLKLSPNESNKIIVPDGTLKFNITSTPRYYVKRGLYLYDPVQHTYDFYDSVYADIVLQLHPDDLPAAASAYLSAKCVYDYVTHAGSGDSTTITRCREEWIMTKSALVDTELQEASINAFNSPLARSIISRLPSAGFSTNNINPRGS